MDILTGKLNKSVNVMNSVQLQVHKFRHHTLDRGSIVFRTINNAAAARIEVMPQREGYRHNATRKLFVIIAMLGMISYLVWNIG